MNEEEKKFKILRDRMVIEQLKSRDIRDKKVLEVFSNIPRHAFVPENLKNDAYCDFPLSIGKGQTISQPYIVALMTQALRLNGTEHVLEIGTGSGYQTAVLAELAAWVYSIERIPELAKQAKNTLDSLNYKNITVKVDDGTCGWEEFAPYDAIIATAGSPDICAPLVDQLKEGGVMVIPLGGSFSQMLTLVEKKGHQILTKDICGCVFVPLLGRYGWK